jgi:hypothetical protein
MNGVECQVGYVTIAQWGKDISNGLEEHDIQSLFVKVIEEI